MPVSTAAVSSAAANELAVTPPAFSGTSHTSPQSDGHTDCYLLLGVVLAILALVAAYASSGDAIWAPKMKVRLLSPKSFPNRLNLNLNLSGPSPYTGNSLIIFTQSINATTACKPCRLLGETLKSATFRKRVYAWHHSNLLRIGQVCRPRAPFSPGGPAHQMGCSHV